ncbi:CHAT domain-containing protein [Candidatus Symbiobacter mobilis]|uniref:CHAT domain-containing protein n=1 Tax=Candidatus Symbiobacter mobilis CR TaxID=946483 RepID=U5N4X7_9BURK|nr:CHAT domain-containing protein [Candidatus Symbiobacter mobilis]AGX86372.1 hypothetical protein Cenrod_0245 [Candidatus Symbiobacter mobilis CR]
MFKYGVSRLAQSVMALTLCGGVAVTPSAWSVDKAEGTVVSGTPLSASAANLFDDARVKLWSADFLAERKSAVVEAVAADLAGNAPHPFAAQVWLRVQESLGVKPLQAVSLAPAAAQEKLAAIADIESLSGAGRNDELLARFPVGDLKKFNDPWAVTLLISAAEAEERLDLAFAYRMASWQLNPQLFSPVWNFIDQFSSKNTLTDRQKALEMAATFAATRSGPAVARIAQDRALYGLDYASIAQLWNDTSDWHALRYRASMAYGSQRWDESIELQRRAESAFPFRNPGVRMAKAMIRANRLEESRRMLAQNALRYAPTGVATERQALADLAAALQEAGEQGEQRSVLDQALNRWPDDVEFLNAKAELEQGSNRPAEAVTIWRRVLLLEPKNAYAWSRLVEASQANGKLQQALDAYRDALAAVGKPDPRLFNVMLGVLQARGEHEEAVKAVRSRESERHLGGWTLRNLALSLQKLGRKPEALEELRRSFVEDGLTAWGADRYFELVDDIHGAAGSEVEIQRLRREFPEASLIADRLETRLLRRSGKDRHPVQVMDDEAIALAPQAYWPYYYRAWEAAEAGNYEEMQAHITRGLAAMPADLQGRRTELLLKRAALTSKIEKQRPVVNADHLRAALADLDEAEKGGYGLGEVHHQRFDILSLLSRNPEAARELMAWSAASPDDGSAVATLFQFSDNAIGARSFLALNRYIHRNPYDGQRLAEGLERHAKWGGSPVVGLAYSRLLEERAPGVAREWRPIYNKSTALNSLGAHQDHYRATYDGSSSIAPSDRYVGWFESARGQAQSNRSFLLPEKLDLVHMHATIVDPSGIEVERGYHPITGRLTFLRVGAASVSAEYDARGINLLRLADSGGSEIRLEYDAQDLITRITQKGGDELSFEYAPNSKPSRISVKGVGDIKIEYDANNEISKVVAGGGPKVALRVTSAFQELLGLSKRFERASADEVPDLPVQDSAFEKLEQAESAVEATVRGKPGKNRDALAERILKAKLATATWLAEHLGDRRKYARDLGDRLAAILEAAWQPGATPATLRAGLDAAVLWHRVTLRLHSHGVAEEDWRKWSRLQAWLGEMPTKAPSLVALSAKVLAQFSKDPLKLMDLAHWLPRSYIDNVGFWQRYPMRSVVPANLAENARAEAVLVRRNGDVVVGSRVGLSVLRRGFWEWFAWDTASERFSPDISYDAAGRALAVLSLAEDSQGALWVGTDNGLVRIAGDYGGAAGRWTLPAPRVERLAPYRDGVLAGTPAGLMFYGEKGAGILPPALAPQQASRITLLKAQEAPDDAQVVLIGTDNTLVGVSGDQVQTLVTGQGVRDAQWLNGRVFILRQNDVTVATWTGEGKPGNPERIADAGGIHFSRQIEGLSALLADDGSQVLAVLTDLGLSLFRDEHFEEKKLPLADRDAVVSLLASAGSKTFMATSEGIYALDRDKVSGDNDGRVYDLLTDTGRGVTFVARGDRLEVVTLTRPRAGARPFSDIKSTRLALDVAGGLITNDGTTILRFPADSMSPTELFDARAKGEGGQHFDAITSLLVASDGTIWVSSGASVFRHKDGQTSEFSIYKDPEVFPARSHMISRVLETVDKRIWVVASDEGHLYFRGQAMKGGLLEWDGRRFVIKETPKDGSWFISSYTNIGPDSAIVGTAAGFARQSGQRYDLVESLKEASYSDLKKRQPMLFLGSRGARLGEDMWLFGTAGGVVALRGGRWILPDRLNWLLPDRHLASYGGRMVHAVATDAAGRIYAGTDRGLLIYETGGADPMQFLLTENLSDLALGELESEKLRAEAGALLPGLPKDSITGKMAQQFSAGNTQIAALKARRDRPNPMLVDVVATQSSGKETASLMPGPNLDQELDQRERAQRELLTRIERDAFGLYQMLELKPIDLDIWRKRLSPEDVVVQYLPTADRLLIHIAKRGGGEVREVAVKSQELYARAQAVSTVIAQEAARLRMDRGANPVLTGDDLLTFQLKSRGAEGLTEELHWLYEQLLRPVEHDLAGYQHVYIVPVGSLAHLPFSALVRSVKPLPEYVAQRMDIGVLPSLYLMDLVLRARESHPGGAAIFGNPDGTLPGAEREAETIRSIVGSNSVVRIGSAATMQALKDGAGDTRWLHLATHGNLNAQDPSKSFLVLAGGTRMSMVDAMLLPLTHTEMVVLSACESGVGANGMDYATLARSFAYAGAPSVVASLWRVNDDATARLMERFYSHRQNGRDVFSALSSAQRDMISSGGSLAAPAAWSGFLAFGRP